MVHRSFAAGARAPARFVSPRWRPNTSVLEAGERETQVNKSCPTHSGLNSRLELPDGSDVGADVAFVWRWLLLGGAAGAWAGLLVGGVGGRLAMFVLRLSSSESVRGIQSDHDFRIGQVTGQTLFLLAITTVLGMVAGIICVIARSQLSGWTGAVLVVLAGGTVGAAEIIQPDGVDFTRLSPLPVACVMFTVIPIAGVALILWFIKRWKRWWWQNRSRTVIAALPWLVAIPTFFISIPVMLVMLALGGAALRVGFLRRGLTSQVGRAVAAGLAITIIGFASFALIRDIVAIV